MACAQYRLGLPPTTSAAADDFRGAWKENQASDGRAVNPAALATSMLDFMAFSAFLFSGVTQDNAR